MDRNKENAPGFFSGVKEAFNREALKRRGNGTLLFGDILVFALAFVFARCHFVFGAYPLAIAFISVLKNGVWLAVFGAVCGSFSLGRVGAIYAVIGLVTLFLRIIVSGGSHGEKKLFSESLPLKIASAGVGALVGGVYQILLNGFSAESLLFALFGISLTSGFVFLFSGIYLLDIGIKDVLFAKKTIFMRKSFASDKEKFDLILYTGSLLVFVYAVGMSLVDYDFLGISATYLYSAVLTLFTAKRFGTARAIAVGFLSALSKSGIYAVSFAFAGLGAGVFFSFGVPYAIIAAASLLSVYGYYVGGVEGIVSTAPEFVLSSLLFLPANRYLSKEREEENGNRDSKSSERMVNIASLSYKNKGARASVDVALSSIKSMARVLSDGGRGEGEVSYEEYRDSVVKDVREHCLSCPSFDACSAESPAPCAENIDLIAEKLSKKERLFIDDINLFPKYCAHREALYDKVINSAQSLESAAKKNRRMSIRSKDYELIYRALSENLKASDAELGLNSRQSDEIRALLEDAGIGEASAKIFGTRRRHIITAGIDEGGKISTSRELKEAIEKKLSAKITDGEFYRKDNYILCEFDELERLECSVAVSSSAKSSEIVNGDSIVSFRGEDGRFYALLSDGEGSGDEAREVSAFACDYLSRMLKSSVSKSTAISSLNHILKNRERERSVTLDLFELDLYTGEGVFYKCGAASSYIKREDSIFKVRSQSAPIGLMSMIDAESIRVDARRGDCVILLSDGVLPENEDSTWFLELVNSKRVGDIKEYADMLLESARGRTRTNDDMSIAIIKINEKQFS